MYVYTCLIQVFIKHSQPDFYSGCMAVGNLFLDLSMTNRNVQDGLDCSTFNYRPATIKVRSVVHYLDSQLNATSTRNNKDELLI